MPESKKKIILYYANWCPHCRAFKPTWEIIKKKLEGKNIIIEEYEDEKHGEIIERTQPPIKSYPTIRITINGHTKDYTGPRTEEDILRAMGIQIQSGGKNTCNNTYYKLKYLKYKAKYFRLLDKINKVL